MKIRNEEMKKKMFIDEKCKDCPYYYGEFDWCMVGEENVPDNLVRKCKKGVERND